MNVTDVTGPCVAVQYGLIMLTCCSRKMESDTTENQLDGTLNYGQFSYWKTETDPSNGFPQTPTLLPLSQFSDDSRILNIQ